MAIRPRLQGAPDDRAGVVVGPQEHRVFAVGLQLPAVGRDYVAVPVDLVGGKYERNPMLLAGFPVAEPGFVPFPDPGRVT